MIKLNLKKLSGKFDNFSEFNLVNEITLGINKKGKILITVECDNWSNIRGYEYNKYGFYVALQDYMILKKIMEKNNEGFKSIRI